MTLKTKVAGFLTFAPGDDVQTYLWRWLAQSWRTTDGLFDPVSGHNHNGSGMNGPIISGGGGVGVPINWRGAWSASTAYAQNDGVNYQGSSYVAATSNVGIAPPAVPWQLVAQQGATGPAGPPGSAGAPGPVGMTWRGPWQTAPTTYVAGDGVSYQGSSYIAIGGNVASPPPSASWDLLAAQGTTGATGAQGPQGNPGATGATGAQGPQGNPGATGAQGATGPAGPVGLVWRGSWASTNAYAVNDAVFYATSGSSYICTSAVSSGGAAPPSDSAHWALLAAGATGTWGSP